MGQSGVNFSLFEPVALVVQVTVMFMGQSLIFGEETTSLLTTSNNLQYRFRPQCGIS